MSKKDNDPTTFPEKWMKVLKSLPEFKDTADAAGPDELKQIVIESEGNIYTVEQEMADDVKLNAAKEMVKELSASYNEAKKAQTAKIKYAMFRLSGLGINIDNTDDED